MTELGSATSGVTPRRLQISRSGFAPSAAITAAFPEPVPLRARDRAPSGLLFNVVMNFSVAAIERGAAMQSWAGTTEMYQYRLLDHDQTEMLV
ncbi:MAG: hypothetical protein U0031_12585 [Thermomicrobiales bacterium]